MSWAPITSTNNSQEISSSWIKENMNKGKFILVDCREQYEWDVDYIEGSLLCPLSDWESSSKKIPNHTPVVVYCRSGKRSLIATNDLLSKGYKAASMVGGILNFRKG